MYRVGKNDRVYYTKYDANIVILRASGKQVVFPSYLQPKLIDRAKVLNKFHWEVF